MKIIELIKSGVIAEGIVHELSINNPEMKYVVYHNGELIRYESFEKESKFPSIIKVYDNKDEEYKEYGNFQYMGYSDNSSSKEIAKVHIYEWSLIS